MAEFLQQCGSWGVLATLAAYAAGVWVNRKTGKALFNPLLMGSIFVIVFLSCFGVPYADYKSSAQPISWLLMPATVSLAIPLYEKWELLEKNLAAIFAAIAAGVLTSLGSVLAMAWVLRIERTHAVSFLPKSVTTAIGMDVAETLGGAAALAGAVIILTGIVGSLMGETVCKVCHITDPLAKGLALGTSAHAIGTSKALQMGEVEGAMSGLAIAVAGIMTAILAPVAANFLPSKGDKGKRRGVEDAAPGARVPLGGAQRAPPVCFANPLLRLFAPQGQTLFATPVSLRSTVAPDSQPRTTSQQRQFSLPAFFCGQKKAASREPAVYPLADTLKNTRYPCAHPRFPVPWIPLTLHPRGACRRAG